MADLEIRPARAEDAPEIVRLIRDGADSNIVDKLIYSCAGAPAYVRFHIEAGGVTNRRYFVATLADRIASCADFTVSLETLWLKYVATDPRARRQGLGKALLRFALAGLYAGQALVELDVSVENTTAVRWYETLGFTPAAHSTYWAFANDERLGCPSMEIPDWPQSQACHAAFGFSEFHLETPSARVKVGRVGCAWFRLPTAEAVCDPEVRGALRAIDPRPGIFAVLPDGPLARWIELNGKRVRRATHMRAPFSTVRGRLGAGGSSGG